MANRSGITVNGVVLEEFVKDVELIEEESERKRLLIESSERTYLNRHIKPKYTDHKEKNGKVRTLSALDISITSYEPKLKKAMDERDYHKAFIIVLLVKHGQTINLHKIADFIENFCTSRNVHVSQKMRHALRAKLGYIKKSELFNYMTFMDRKNPQNKFNYAIFSLDSEKAADLTIEKALELGSQLREGEKYNPGPKVQPESTKIQKPEKKPPAVSESIKIPEEKQLDKAKNFTESVIQSINDVIKSGSLVNVQGDIHIHINIRS